MAFDELKRQPDLLYRASGLVDRNGQIKHDQAYDALLRSLRKWGKRFKERGGQLAKQPPPDG